MTTASAPVKTRTEGRKKFLHYVFTTAFEGGVNYWAEAITYRWTTGGVDGRGMPIDDLDGFHAMVSNTERDWGVETAYQPVRGNRAEPKEVIPIEHNEILRVDIDVVERGVNLFIDKVIEATKSGDPNAPFSRDYYRQFMTQWLTDGEEGDSDADVCDTVVQLGLFGQVVYG